MQTHSEIGERILVNVDTTVRSPKSFVTTMNDRRKRLPRWVTDGDSVARANHRRGGCVQRDDFKSTVPRGDAEQVARLRLAQAVGTQFDVSVVAAFEAILATADEDYRSGVDLSSG